jgi:hypothetical protein
MKRGILVVRSKKMSSLVGVGYELLKKARCWKRQRTISPALNRINKIVNR